MGIKDIKKAAYMGASKVAMSPSVLRVLSNPKVQRAFLTMLNANADVQDWFSDQMKTRAKNLSLATHEELIKVQRELRHQVAEMEIMEDRVVELGDKIASLEKTIAGLKRSTGGAAVAKKAAPKKAAPKKAAPKKAAPKKAAPKKAAPKKAAPKKKVTRSGSKARK